MNETLQTSSPEKKSGQHPGQLTCPECGVLSPSTVIDSRYSPPMQGIRRRRACDACGHRYTTCESVVDESMVKIDSLGLVALETKAQAFDAVVTSLAKHLRPAFAPMETGAAIETDATGEDAEATS